MTGARRSAGRRGTPVDQVVTILWRDVPAQVSATWAGVTQKAMLPSRFQVAIDRAARVAGLTDRHDYVAQWRRVTRDLTGPVDDLAALVADEVARLDAAYDREALAALVRAGGVRDDEPRGTDDPSAAARTDTGVTA